MKFAQISAGDSCGAMEDGFRLREGNYRFWHGGNNNNASDSTNIQGFDVVAPHERVKYNVEKEYLSKNQSTNDENQKLVTLYNQVVDARIECIILVATGAPKYAKDLQFKNCRELAANALCKFNKVEDLGGPVVPYPAHFRKDPKPMKA